MSLNKPMPLTATNFRPPIVAGAVGGKRMNLLFKRGQTEGAGKVTFKLWAKTELDEDEQRIIKRYRFDSAKLIDVFQPNLLRNAILIAFGVGAVVSLVLLQFLFGLAQRAVGSA